MAIFERAAAVVPVPRAPQPIVIADYGAATGHNSLLPICAAIEVLRKRTRPDQSVLVIHTDLPDNDFTAMFRTLAEDPDTYLGKDSATFASAVGRSFYEQVMPSGSVHLAWSSWAIQWLSKVPAPIPDHILAGYSGDEDTRAAYARQAAHDWHEFIAFRGRELRRGGRLVVMTMAVGEDGEFGYRPLFESVLDTLDEFRRDGLLTEDEVRGMSIPVFARSEKDFFAPFAPSGRFEQLEIDHLEVFHAEDRFWSQYQAASDATAFGASWASFVRAAVLPTLLDALAGGRDDPRAAQFLDRLEAGVAQRLAAAPEQMQIPLAHLVLIKRPKPR
jgi:hypothetical protein